MIDVWMFGFNHYNRSDRSLCYQDAYELELGEYRVLIPSCRVGCLYEYVEDAARLVGVRIVQFEKIFSLACQFWGEEKASALYRLPVISLGQINQRRYLELKPTLKFLGKRPPMQFQCFCGKKYRRSDRLTFVRWEARLDHSSKQGYGWSCGDKCIRRKRKEEKQILWLRQGKQSLQQIRRLLRQSPRELPAACQSQSEA